MPDIILTSERLILRPFEEGDGELVMRISSDPETTKYLYFWGRPGMTPRQDAERFLYQHALKEWKREPVRMREYVLVLKETGERIGDASIEEQKEGTGEIGWILLPEYRGRGYATEAARRLLTFGFEELGLRRIGACCDCRNPASARVMERAGMHLTERVPEGRPDKGDGVRADELVYEIDRADWWWTRTGSDNYIRTCRQKLGHDLITFVGAAVFLYRDGQFLLQRRADDGKWSCHGGCNEPGEPVRDTAARELKEETGLTAKKLELIGLYSGKSSFHTYPNGDMAWIVDTAWLCTEFEGEMKRQECEVTELKWFSRDALPPREEWLAKIWEELQDCLPLIQEKEGRNGK